MEKARDGKYSQFTDTPRVKDQIEYFVFVSNKTRSILHAKKIYC